MRSCATSARTSSRLVRARSMPTRPGSTPGGAQATTMRPSLAKGEGGGLLRIASRRREIGDAPSVRGTDQHRGVQACAVGAKLGLPLFNGHRDRFCARCLPDAQYPSRIPRRVPPVGGRAGPYRSRPNRSRPRVQTIAPDHSGLSRQG